MKHLCSLVAVLMITVTTQSSAETARIENGTVYSTERGDILIRFGDRKASAGCMFPCKTEVEIRNPDRNLNRRNGAVCTIRQDVGGGIATIVNYHEKSDRYLVRWTYTASETEAGVRYDSGGSVITKRWKLPPSTCPQRTLFLIRGNVLRTIQKLLEKEAAEQELVHELLE